MCAQDSELECVCVRVCRRGNITKLSSRKHLLCNFWPDPGELEIVVFDCNSIRQLGVPDLYIFPLCCQLEK